MYKGDTGEAESQGQEAAMFRGNARDHRRILGPCEMYKAKVHVGEANMFMGTTKVKLLVIPKAQLLITSMVQLLVISKVQLLVIPKAQGTRCSTYNTGEAKFHGKEVAMIGGIARDHRRILESSDICKAKNAGCGYVQG